jgi:flagellar basal body-associated protein FliL
MKGISLSVNLIVVLGIVVLVLAAVLAFFFSGSFGQISQAEAQRVFAAGCARYCEPNLYATFKNAYDASRNDPSFVNACVALKYGDKDHVNKCLGECSNCNLDVQEAEIQSGLENLNTMTTRG